MAAKILVVDDQANMCWILSKILAKAGFAVATAQTGKDALAIVANGEVTVAIIDYRLPDMTGIQLLARIQERHAPLPAFLITSYGSKALRQEALRAGFAGYFDKPFRNQTLVDALKRVVMCDAGEQIPATGARLPAFRVTRAGPKGQQPRQCRPQLSGTVFAPTQGSLCAKGSVEKRTSSMTLAVVRFDS